MKNATAVKGNNIFGLKDVASFKAGIYFIEMICNNAVVAKERFVKN